MKKEEKLLVELLNAVVKETKLSDVEIKEALKDCLEEIQEFNIISRLPGEEFRLVPGTSRFYASNLGRVIKLTNDGERLCRQRKTINKTNKEYFDILVEDSDNNKYYARVSRIIAKAWLDETLGLLYKDDKRIVDHINNDSKDNRLENLRILKNNRANIRAAVYEQGRVAGKHMKKCYAYNKETGEAREYPSTCLLCEDIFNSSNKGYFNNYAKNKMKTNTGWIVGYNLNELKGE